MFKSNGTVVARFDYDPWGRSTAVINTTLPDFNFTGLYRHSLSNLDLAVYRAYDPDLGRWLNRDPIGEDGGINLYTYVGNSPIAAIDEDGLCRLWLEKRDTNSLGNFVGRATGLVVKHWFLRASFYAGDLKCCPEAGYTTAAFTLETGLGMEGGELPGQRYQWNPFVRTQPVDHSGQTSLPGTQELAVPGKWDCCELYKFMTSRQPTAGGFLGTIVTIGHVTSYKVDRAP